MIMHLFRRIPLVAVAAFLAACSDAPSGPTRMGAPVELDAPVDTAGMIEAVVLPPAFASRAGPDGTAGYHERVQVGFTEWVPCANGGAGELVTFNGMYHQKYTETLDAHGNLKLRWHGNPAMLVGTGEESGATYHAVGTSRSRDFQAPGYSFPTTFEASDVWHVVTRGGGNDFYMRTRAMIVVDETGHVTLDDVEFTTECR